MPLLPLFPLPNVVLFPGVRLPLHIFEPRYRAMVADALESDRRIGMVLLRAGFERDYEGSPPIHAIGCSGVIVDDIRLMDGRYNIVLHGLDRFRVLDEQHDRTYRRATIAPMPDAPLDEKARRAVRELRRGIEARLGLRRHAPEAGDAPQGQQLAALPDGDFVHAIAQHLDLDPIEKLALLECDSLRSRAEALIDLIDIKRFAARMPAGRDVTH
jgi:Lon protease-like protein